MVISDQHNIFIAYAKADENILVFLRKHLSILERSEDVNIWYDGKIDLGKDWAAETNAALENATIILLLVSADFIASDFAYEHQMKKALELHEQGKAKVIPIIVRDCVWESAPFSHLKVLPLNGVHTTSSIWDTEDEPYTQITNELNTLIATQKADEPQPKTHKRGRVLYRIPAKMQKDVTSSCTIRIAPEDVPESILKAALEEADKAIIEDIRRIGKYMKVELVNDSTEGAFHIKAKSTEEQVIEDDDYSEWLFDVTPLVEGTHSLQLTVSVTLVRDTLGKEYKDVVVLDRDVEIVSTAVEENVDWAKVEDDKALILTAPEKEDMLEKTREIVVSPSSPQVEETTPSSPTPTPSAKPVSTLRKYRRGSAILLLFVFFIPPMTWALAPNVVTPIILNQRYDDSRKLSDDRTAVKKDGKWGIVNKWGIESVAPEYDEIKDSENDISQVRKNGKWGALKQTDKKEKSWWNKAFHPKDKIVVPAVTDTIKTILNDEVDVQIGNRRLTLPMLSDEDISEDAASVSQEEQEILSIADSLLQLRKVEKAEEKLLKLSSKNINNPKANKQVERKKTKWTDKYTTQIYEAAANGDSAKVEGLKKNIKQVKSIKPKTNPSQKTKPTDKQKGKGNKSKSKSNKREK